MKNKKLIRKVWENYEPIHEKTTVDMSLPKELKLKLQADSGFFFGLRKKAENYAGKPAEMDGHILVAGGPGTGKTSGIVIPTMRTWRGSQIILDVKGDLHHYHSFFSKRLLWFSPGSEKSCRYDPFALLRQDSPDNLAGHAMDLAMALIPLASSAHEPVWTHAAQTFLAGAIVYYFKEGYSFVQAMTELQIVPIGEIMEQVMKSSDELAKSFFCKLGEVQGKVLSNIGLELCQLITFSTDKAVQSALSQVGDTPMLDWSWYSTTEEPFDVILHIPESNLDRWKSLLLMLVNQLIKSLERRPQYTGVQKRRLPPLLVMLDEFPRIGPITSIVSGLATLRSRGVTFALFVQSISDLERIYGYTTARGIADLCAFKAVLGVADATSQKYFSELAGTVSSIRKSISVQLDPKNGKVVGVSGGINDSMSPVIYPHEFLFLKDIVLFTPFKVCRTRKHTLNANSVAQNY